MLIENSEIKENDVITLKLVGGDEVVGRLSSDGSESIVLSKPLLVVMAQQGFGLMPYILTADPTRNVSINSTHVISKIKTIDAVAKEYIKQTTGLVI